MPCVRVCGSDLINSADMWNAETDEPVTDRRWYQFALY